MIGTQRSLYFVPIEILRGVPAPVSCRLNFDAVVWVEENELDPTCKSDELVEVPLPLDTIVRKNPGIESTIRKNLAPLNRFDVACLTLDNVTTQKLEYSRFE